MTEVCHYMLPLWEENTTPFLNAVQYSAHYQVGEKGLGQGQSITVPQSFKKRMEYYFKVLILVFILTLIIYNINDCVCTLDSMQSFSSIVYRGALGEARLRNKRGILELAGAIRCTTGRSPFAYLRYGCYCGLGGRGWPKDRVDW